MCPFSKTKSISKLFQAPKYDIQQDPLVYSVHICTRYISSPLQLALDQVVDHLATGDASGVPKGREVEGAGKTVGETKEEHGRDPATSVLESEAALGHLVLLDIAAAKVVNATSRVDLGGVLARDVSQLSSGEDVEVVVGGVATGVTLGTNGSAYKC